jgi:hypothetical protein
LATAEAALMAEKINRGFRKKDKCICLFFFLSQKKKKKSWRKKRTEKKKTSLLYEYAKYQY